MLMKKWMFLFSIGLSLCRPVSAIVIAKTQPIPEKCDSISKRNVSEDRPAESLPGRRFRLIMGSPNEAPEALKSSFFGAISCSFFLQYFIVPGGWMLLAGLIFGVFGIRFLLKSRRKKSDAERAGRWIALFLNAPAMLLIVGLSIAVALSSILAVLFAFYLAYLILKFL